MCSSKAKVGSTGDDPAAAVAKINGRPVLQPTASSCNRVPAATLERRNSLKKLSTKSPLPPASFTSIKDVSKKNKNNDEDDGNCENADNASFKSPRPAAIKRTAATTTTTTKVVVGGPCLDRKKSKSFKETNTSLLPSSVVEASLSYSSSLIVDSPGSIAAVRREHMALQHAQRKMRIAHYGRSKSAKFTMMMSNDDYDHQAEATVPINKNNNNSNNMFDMMTMYTYASSNTKETSTNNLKSKNNPPDSIVLAESTSTRGRRCSFITPNSDPIYVAYHDQEWGVPVHDDAMLFELLVLSGAQVGSDWVSILKRRQHFRDAFSGFDPQTVASITDKQMLSISAEYGIDISRIRGVVDNSKRILETKKEFGSFDKYIWAFVNNKPIITQYKFGHKVPVKTSKSECISKDMVRRGFRFVGPTVIHSFMQAAGLTNDHLITCHRHLQCTLLAAPNPNLIKLTTHI